MSIEKDRHFIRNASDESLQLLLSSIIEELVRSGLERANIKDTAGHSGLSSSVRKLEATTYWTEEDDTENPLRESLEAAAINYYYLVEQKSLIDTVLRNRTVALTKRITKKAA